MRRLVEAELFLQFLHEFRIETLRARDPLTAGDPAKRFLRLRFERAP